MGSEEAVISLDQLVEQRVDKAGANKDPSLPYVGLEHLAQGEPVLLGTLNSGASVSIYSVFSRDDILFGKLRPNLRKSVQVDFGGYCSTDILVLRPRPGIIPGFAARAPAC